MTPPPITIHAACSPGEIRAAAMQNGALIDYAIHRPGAPNNVGDRIRARVLTHIPAMAGAFLALPGGTEGFLPDSQAPPNLHTGAAITVLITRAAIGGKGPRLSARTPQEPPGPPALLTPGPGAIARLVALHPAAQVTVDDPAAATPGATILPHAWDDEIETQIEALSAPSIDLPGNITAHIHPTPALVAIDLDASPGNTNSKPTAQREANRAAIPALAHAIRLRNLSGAIVIDLAGMAIKARASLTPDLTQALARDPLNPRFLGFTALGLAEILRPRIYPPLHELLAGPHAAALAALRKLARADPATAHTLHTTPEIARALDEDPHARADLARRTGRPLMLRADPALPPGRWKLETLTRAPTPPKPR